MFTYIHSKEKIFATSCVITKNKELSNNVYIMCFDFISLNKIGVLYSSKSESENNHIDKNGKIIV